LVATSKSRLTMNNTTQQTAHAFLTVYKALPEEVRQEVKQLILREQENESVTGADKDRLARYRQLEETIAPLRKDLPAGYKFNREEANER
jgi:hypothetical protein